jgi:hypothetical protein
MDEHTEMLRLATGTGIVHHLGREEGPVQRSEAEGKQCEVFKLGRWWPESGSRPLRR